jgi:hypothetical protein
MCLHCIIPCDINYNYQKTTITEIQNDLFLGYMRPHR